jgi:hypothetical protein
MLPEAFSPVPNAWGRQGWTTADLSRLGEEDLENALRMAWERAQPKKPARR